MIKDSLDQEIAGVKLKAFLVQEPIELYEAIKLNPDSDLAVIRRYKTAETLLEVMEMRCLQYKKYQRFTDPNQKVVTLGAKSRLTQIEEEKLETFKKELLKAYKMKY